MSCNRYAEPAVLLNLSTLVVCYQIDIFFKTLCKRYLSSKRYKTRSFIHIWHKALQNSEKLTKMTKVLKYFELNGLAEAIRYILHYTGQKFEDVRYDHSIWPIKEVKDGKSITLWLKYMRLSLSLASNWRWLSKECLYRQNLLIIEIISRLLSFK